jgi:hypothetical protein
MPRPRTTCFFLPPRSATDTGGGPPLPGCCHQAVDAPEVARCRCRGCVCRCGAPSTRRAAAPTAELFPPPGCPRRRGGFPMPMPMCLPPRCAIDTEGRRCQAAAARLVVLPPRSPDAEAEDDVPLAAEGVRHRHGRRAAAARLLPPGCCRPRGRPMPMPMSLPPWCAIDTVGGPPPAELLPPGGCCRRRGFPMPMPMCLPPRCAIDTEGRRCRAAAAARLLPARMPMCLLPPRCAILTRAAAHC